MINLCFNLVLMFICFVKYSSVINLIYSVKQLLILGEKSVTVERQWHKEPHLLTQHAVFLKHASLLCYDHKVFMDDV